MAHSGTLGDLRFFTSNFSMQVAPGNFRCSRKLGGGPLYDIGIYCINAARAAFAAEPMEVLATAIARRDHRFKEIPETVAVVMTASARNDMRRATSSHRSSSTSPTASSTISSRSRRVRKESPTSGSSRRSTRASRPAAGYRPSCPRAPAHGL
jgi:predicted dehydrogenase